jgi:hypothetical protein
MKSATLWAAVTTLTRGDLVAGDFGFRTIAFVKAEFPVGSLVVCFIGTPRSRQN